MKFTQFYGIIYSSDRTAELTEWTRTNLFDYRLQTVWNVVYTARRVTINLFFARVYSIKVTLIEIEIRT